MEIKIKKLHPDAVIPKYAKEGDAGLDLTCISKKQDRHNLIYGTGLSVEIPEGHVGLIFPRSSLTNYDLSLGNHVGIIDSNYRGEIIFKFRRQAVMDETGSSYLGHTLKEYNVGDKIGQIIIVPYPKVEFVEVDQLSESERGSGGFGSSGA